MRLTQLIYDDPRDAAALRRSKARVVCISICVLLFIIEVHVRMPVLSFLPARPLPVASLLLLLELGGGLILSGRARGHETDRQTDEQGKDVK